MRVRLALITVAFLAVVSPLRATSNDAAWRADIDYLAAELPRLHVNPFTRVSREAYDTAVTELRNNVASLADHEVVAGLMRVLAMIGDSHTTLYGGGSTRFPVGLQWFSDGLYVVRSTEEHRDLLGLRLVAIDMRSLDDVLGAVAGLIPHENDYWLREMAAEQIASPEILHALRVIPTLQAASFRFETSDGTTLDRLLDRLPPGATPSVEQLREDQKPLYLRNVRTNYWYEYMPQSGTLFVQYNRCAQIPSRPVAAFGAELGELARTRPVSRLILDLRHNGGGDSGLIAPMLMDLYLSAPYLDDPDRFFVITGPRTFSSALMNAIEIDDNTRATLIGLPTGGKPNHFGDVRTFVLPWSGITVQFSTRWFALAPDGDPPALMPEIEIPISSSDYAAGRDPVMDHVVPQLPRRRAVAR